MRSYNNLVKNAARKPVRVWADTQRNELLVETTRLIIAAHRPNAHLAKDMGISPSTIGAWIGGTTRCARTDTLAKALHVLGCRLAIVPDNDYKPN